VTTVTKKSIYLDVASRSLLKTLTKIYLACHSHWSDGVLPLLLRTMKLSLCTAISVLCWCLAAPVTAAPLSAGKGNFLYTDASGDADKPVTVWYYKPATLGANKKVLFVMHGADRHGESYRDHWVPYAEKYNFLLVVPEFAEKHFSTSEYEFGNVTDPRQERWSFWIIERLFDQLRQRDASVAGKYYLFGHSAGAQFVHRFMLFMPAPRVQIAFAANAGAYTMPVYPEWLQSSFPMTLDKTLVSEQRLASAFSRRLVLMLGEQDIDDNSEGLPRSPEAMEQGKNRFERGQKFFQMAQRQAAAQNTPLNWKLVTVPKVGHSHADMAKAAMGYLFEK
jgi:poly(3-hydroxybutyrate) depolymerase